MPSTSTDYDLERAIENSLISSYKTNLTAILPQLQAKIRSESVTHVNIYRNDIFNCFVRAVNRESYNSFNKLWVKFTDIEGTAEGAIDMGGPTREMFCLLFNYIKDCLFIGEKKKNLRFDRDFLDKSTISKLAVL